MIGSVGGLVPVFLVPAACAKDNQSNNIHYIPWIIAPVGHDDMHRSQILGTDQHQISKHFQCPQVVF